MKPVPDPASAGERLGPDGRLDRGAVPAVVNGNDEYALEAALKLTEAHGGEVTLLSMAPVERARDDAQGPRDGGGERPPRHRSGAGGLLHGLDDARAGGGPRLDDLRPRAGRGRHLRRRLGRGRAGRRGPGRAAAPVVRRPDRARPGGRHRPGPADHAHRLRRARGADARAHHLHPGARRAALPVAQGDHGRAVQGDHDGVARRTSAWTPRPSAARSPRPASPGRRRPRPVPPRG